jgi:hypothetical protein
MAISKAMESSRKLQTGKPDPSKGEMKVGRVINVVDRIRWIKLPSSSMSDVRWWPGILYESYQEFCSDIGESIKNQMQ